MVKKAPSPKAPSIDAPIIVDAGDASLDTAPLGAHVSIAGGTWEAAARAREISATAAQIFTKQANRWAEREITPDELSRFRSAFAATQVRWMCAHDSYLINLASPDPDLRAKSIESFRFELRRCHALSLDALVSHPGNYIDNRDDGIARNAEAIGMALDAEEGPTLLLLELTAGQGTVLGAQFEEMAELLDAIPSRHADRLGVCLDTAHVWAAGYDLVNAYDDVIRQLDAHIGVSRLRCLHLNDSKAMLGSHLDRHNLIGEGSIGPDAFRRIMTDTRLAEIPKIIETPKGSTPAENDGKMLKRLREYASGASFPAGCLALLTALLIPLGAPSAQTTDTRVRPHVELGAAPGGTWLDGPNAPTVSTGIGLLGGLGVSRGFSPVVDGGLVVRAVSSSVQLEEAGTTWEASRALEVSLLASTSLHSRRPSALRVSLDVLAGVTHLAGPRDVVPFRDASSFSPVGEVGVSVRRRSAETQRARGDLALFVRYNMTRVGINARDATGTAGTVSRIVAGVRLTR